MKTLETLPFILLFLAGLGDYLTTSYASSLGFEERNPFYVPFLATLILSGVVAFCMLIKKPVVVVVGIIAFLIICAWLPSINNLLVINSAYKE